jgi:hypothetical protein
MSSHNEPIVITIEELEPIRGGAKLTTVSCTFFLPTKYMEVPIVVVSTQVEELEEPINPNLFH